MSGRARLLIAVIAIFGMPVVPSASGGRIHGHVICRTVADCTDALVYLERIPGRMFPPGAVATMDQIALTFVPHVLPILVGTTVAFPNSDELRHNVFSVSPAKRFNLGTYPQGVTKDMVFDKPGVVELLCNVHTQMSAYIVVLEAPYVARVGADGAYEVRDVPPGTYEIAAWHPGLEPQRRAVTVREDESVSRDFELRR